MEHKMHKRPKTKLHQTYSCEVDGRVIHFSVGIKGYSAGQDIVIGYSPAAYYSTDPVYLTQQIRFFYDEIFSDKDNTSRMIIVNAGSLGRHTVRMQIIKDSKDQEESEASIDSKVVIETKKIEKNFERLFFGGEHAALVEKMVRSGRLVYTTWDDWHGNSLPTVAMQPDDKQDEDIANARLDAKILELRKFSAGLESNRDLFAAFGTNHELFQENYKKVLEEYETEGSDVRTRINKWVDVFYGQSCKPSDMEGQEEKIPSIRELILSYCLEEAVGADIWGDYAPQMAYAFGLCSALAEASMPAWGAVSECLGRKKVNLLTLNLPPKEMIYLSEAEKVRLEVEARERRIAELEKTLEKVQTDLEYRSEKLRLAKTSKFRERLVQEAVDGLDKVVEYASSSSNSEESPEASEDDTKSASPPKYPSPLDSGRGNSTGQPRVAAIKTPDSVSPESQSPKSKVSPTNSTNNLDSSRQAGRKNSADKGAGTKISTETVHAAATLGHFGTSKKPASSAPMNMQGNTGKKDGGHRYGQKPSGTTSQ